MSEPDITPTNYTHDESYSSMSEEERSGIVSTIIDKVLDRLGISEELVEKTKTVIDNIDIQKYGEKTVISIDMKKITIVIDK
jgi:hypothetical protein